MDEVFVISEIIEVEVKTRMITLTETFDNSGYQKT